MIRRYGSKRYERNVVVLQSIFHQNDVVTHRRFWNTVPYINPNMTLLEMFPDRGRRVSNYYDMTKELWESLEDDWLTPRDFSPTGPGRVRITRYATHSGISPKPTWNQILRWVDEWELEESIRYFASHNVFSLVPREAKDHALSEPFESALTEAGVGIHHGFAHLDSMVYHAHYTAQPGMELPTILLPDSNNEIIDIWTHSELHDMLSVQARKVNAYENARNVLELELRKKAKPWFDTERGGLEEGATPEEVHQARLANYLEIVEDLKQENIDKAIQDEVNRQQKEFTYPDEPHRAKQVFAMRSGVFANRRRNWILGVVDAQSAFLPESCLEERGALQQVATLWQRFNNQLDRIDDLDEMVSLFETYKSDLLKITVTNTPEWRNPDGTPITLNSDGVLEIVFDKTKGNIAVELLARSPGELRTTDDGIVSIRNFQQEEESEPWNTNVWFLHTFSNSGDGQFDRRCNIQYVVGDLDPPDEAVVELDARNGCGPSALRIKIKRKQDEQGEPDPS